MGFMDIFRRKPEDGAKETPGLTRRLTGSTPRNNTVSEMKSWHINSKFEVDLCSKGGCTALYGHYPTQDDAELELNYIKRNPKKWKALNSKQDSIAIHNPQVKWDYDSKPDSRR